MAKVELIMPKMGESIMEATILKWLKKPGDKVNQDETILEIATDKVDSEIPSPVSGTILETLFAEDAIVEIGKVIAYIGTEGEAPSDTPAKQNTDTPKTIDTPSPKTIEEVAKPLHDRKVQTSENMSSDRFYSPLVKNIAKEEGISIEELDQIIGSGKDGRVTKQDMIAYLDTRSSSPTLQDAPSSQSIASTPTKAPAPPSSTPSSPAPSGSLSGDAQVDRRSYGHVEAYLAACNLFCRSRCDQYSALERKKQRKIPTNSWGENHLYSINI